MQVFWLLIIVPRYQLYDVLDVNGHAGWCFFVNLLLAIVTLIIGDSSSSTNAGGMPSLSLDTQAFSAILVLGSESLFFTLGIA